MPVNLTNGVMRKIMGATLSPHSKKIAAVMLECGHRTIVRSDMPGSPTDIFEGKTEAMCLKCRPPVREVTHRLHPDNKVCPRCKGTITESSTHRICGTCLTAWPKENGDV